MTTLQDISLINLPVVEDARGNLAYIQPGILPFDFKRVYYLFDVPSSSFRGGHCHINQLAVLIALSGSFDVVITDANGYENRISMNRSFYGLYLPPMTYRHLDNFSSNAVSLHLSSGKFEDSEYVR